MMDDKDVLIIALKASNKGRGIVICKLIKDGLEKDNEIFKLKLQIEELLGWIEQGKRLQDAIDRFFQ